MMDKEETGGKKKETKEMKEKVRQGETFAATASLTALFGSAAITSGGEKYSIQFVVQ